MRDRARARREEREAGKQARIDKQASKWKCGQEAMSAQTQPGEQKYEWTPTFWKGWRERANVYRHYKSKRDRVLALELLGLRDGERVLEVGCGYGWVSRALWGAAKIEWMGGDRSGSMLSELKPNAEGRPLIRMDACRLPLADASFDKVLCSGVLMHVWDDQEALKELARVLRPGGRLVFTINNALSPYAAPVRLHNLRKKGFIQNFRVPGAMRKLARELGLRPLEMRGDGFITTQPVCVGPFSVPPQSLHGVLLPMDEWLVTRFPGMAFEVWFSAVKPTPE